MSTLKVNTIKDNGTAIDIENGILVGGVSPAQNYTASGTEPSSGNANGDYWWDTGNEKLYQYWNSAFREITTSPPPPLTSHIGDRMVVAGGNSPATSAIRYIDLTGSGGSTSFGSLTSARNGLSGASDGSRGVFAGGVVSNYIDNIEYVTISTPGNSTDFGDLTGISMVSSASDGTTAIFAMWDGAVTYNGNISQITIATTGNATTRSGTLSQTRSNACGASDGTKGFFFGGYASSGRVNTIDYVTIATDSNAIDWGDLTSVRYQQGQNSACGTDSRVLHAGGNDGITYTNTIEYINPASASNATDFGDLTVGLRFTTSACNSTKACWVGGKSTSAVVNTQQTVTIDTAANATTFGTYNAALQSMGALSGAPS